MTHCLTFNFHHMSQYNSFPSVWRGLTEHRREHPVYVISSLVTVCPCRSSVHRFLGLTSTKQRVNVTCSREQRKVHRRGIEPGTPWSEIRHPIYCATPPLPALPVSQRGCSKRKQCIPVPNIAMDIYLYRM